MYVIIYYVLYLDDYIYIDYLYPSMHIEVSLVSVRDR